MTERNDGLVDLALQYWAAGDFDAEEWFYETETAHEENLKLIALHGDAIAAFASSDELYEALGTALQKFIKEYEAKHGTPSA